MDAKLKIAGQESVGIAASHGASTNLDFLRSLAVLMVLFDHLCRHYHHDRIGRIGVADIGIFGVLLFFVHTSLVLMYSMQLSGLTGSSLVRNFYIRRFFRIYPLSILTVLAAVVLHLHADGRGLSFGARPGPLELVSNLLLIQNLTLTPSVVGPLWTLPLEVQMYVLLPFLYLWRKRSFLSLLGLWLGCAYLGHFQQTMPFLAWFSLLLYIPNFLPGIMAFTLRRRPIIAAWCWPPFLFSIAIAYAAFPTRRMGGFLCLLLGASIPLFKEMSWRPMKILSANIATYSYGIYLGHSFCIWLALGVFHSWTLFLLIIVALPVMLYHGLERPAIQFGIRLANRTAVKQPSPAAVAA
jgi:peptidoglycan/LPS O-acetylase OafA/YrhL